MVTGVSQKFSKVLIAEGVGYKFQVEKTKLVLNVGFTSSGSGAANLTIKEVYAGNNAVVNTFSNINTIQFDADSGMAVVDESNNTVTIQLNSTFKYWNIGGAAGLEAMTAAAWASALDDLCSPSAAITLARASRAASASAAMAR
jgi:hypothetical protein